MEKYSQLQKTVAILLAFTLMIEFTGCYSKRIIAESDIKTTDLFLIHISNTAYPINNVVKSDGILTGNIAHDFSKSTNIITNHIYLSSDSAIAISDYLISVPVGNIEKIEQKYRDDRKTKTLTTVLIVGGIGLVVLSIISVVAVAKTVDDVANSLAEGCNSY